MPPLPSYQNVKSPNGKVPSHSIRVQSPNRNDFKDFSTASGAGGSREFRSPLKQLNSRLPQVNRNQEHGKNLTAIAIDSLFKKIFIVIIY